MITSIEKHQEEIFHDLDFKILYSSFATEDVLNILERTFYGSHGLSYRHRNIRERAGKTVNPHFFTLYKGDNPIGTFCLSERILINKGYPEKGFYGRYLSILPEFGRKGMGTLLKEKAYEYIRKSEPRPFIVYSYIEEANKYSLKLSRKQGNKPAGIYEVLSFSRFNPKFFPGFSRLEKERIDELKKLFKEYYSAYQLVVLDYIGRDNNYFVIRNKGEIIAGVQAVPAHWQFKTLPGLSGLAAQNILPFIPKLSKVFNPKNYHFIAFDSVYVKQGFENIVPMLFESVLAAFNCHSGIYYGDPKSPITKSFKVSDRGFLSKIESKIQPMIMLSSHNTHSQWQTMDKGLFYVSAFDQV
ncbi:MAG: GNAT family N-acetyltransferase [Sporocytophaga sp.]|uniref:GNAT family N-acetyltransferase n=1 Tax=Sporocytophaga sp. TaxID=2231183 RepID=UPI001B0D8BC9|nr:GNAT family N-acetyltransferase [Sporocytophaga sp.]MBO9702393.1 GNAT family N-acetyltransferase [Sporocytophaga sp.]